MQIPVSYPYPVHYLDLVHGGRMAYMDTLKGSRTILFIHGLTGYGPAWKQNIEELKDHYRCIAIDLPGNGLSDASPRYQMDLLAGCVLQLIAELKLKNVILAGHSMGAQIALSAVLKEPRCATALILFAPAGFETFSSSDKSIMNQGLSYAGWLTSDEEQIRQSISSAFSKISPEVKRMSNDLIALMKAGKMNHYKKMVEQCVNAMLDAPVFDRLPEIKQPVIVFFGEDDQLIPNRMLHSLKTRQVAKAGTDQLPHAKLFMIKNAGHFVHWEQPAVVNKLIREFLA